MTKTTKTTAKPASKATAARSADVQTRFMEFMKANNTSPDAWIAALGAVQKLAKRDEARRTFEAQVVEAFRAAGFEDLRPHETILTAKKWHERGFEPKGGQPVFVRAPWHSHPGMGYALWHVSQVEAIEPTKA